MLDAADIQFLRAHLELDPGQLLLSASGKKVRDKGAVALQLEALRKVRDKLPLWFACPEVYYPSITCVEQCSSHLTAAYKPAWAQGRRVLDLTGGLGVDTLAFRQVGKEVCYVEQDVALCQAARSNFAHLCTPDIEVVCADAQEFLHDCATQGRTFDTVYVDPARRDDSGKRLYAIEDCSPNLLELLPAIFELAPCVLLKLSPMADITHTLEVLPHVAQVHVLAVKNECKELFLVLHRTCCVPRTQVQVVCVHFPGTGPMQRFAYTWGEERDAVMREGAAVAPPAAAAPSVAVAPPDAAVASEDAPASAATRSEHLYLFEPNAAVMKAGPFHLLAQYYGLQALHPHSHLYTGDHDVPDFCGRRFVVLRQEKAGASFLKKLGREVTKAHITVRNFPLSVAQLRARTGIAEGGDLYLFATTKQPHDEKIIFFCSRL